MTLRRARKAIKSVDSSQLARMAKSRDMYVRCMVAKNHNTDSATLTLLARDEASTVRSAVAENPATPMNILRQMVENPPENGHYWGWEEMARRDDLSADVVEAFSTLGHPPCCSPVPAQPLAHALNMGPLSLVLLGRQVPI